MTKSGGRAKGTRNKLGGTFLAALLSEFEQYGEEVIRICRVERPHEFLKIVELVDSRLTDITDEELDLFIELARRQLITGSVVRDAGIRETETVDGKPPQLLPPVQTSG